MITTEQLLEMHRKLSLLEDKHLGSRRGHAAERDVLTSFAQQLHPDYARSQKQAHEPAARRAVAGLQSRFAIEMVSQIGSFVNGVLSRTRLTDRLRDLVRESFTEAYRLGLQSVGAHTLGAPHQVTLHPEDTRWIDSAVRQEIGYLNGFIDDAANDNLRMPLYRRAQMYSDSLFAIWHAGRAMGHPEQMLIYWVSHHDQTTCPECKMLDQLSPFTRDRLPTTPGAGACRCLTNCRCKLIYRTATVAQFERAIQDQLTSRYLLNLLRQSRQTARGLPRFMNL